MAHETMSRGSGLGADAEFVSDRATPGGTEDDAFLDEGALRLDGSWAVLAGPDGTEDGPEGGDDPEGSEDED